jgi:signal transduction histidine kinase
MDTRGTLLVVDDLPDNVKLLMNFLNLQGFKVLVARDGLDGLEIAQYAKPDLILLDVMMPGMDGFEVCERLKSQAETRDIPIIFMTALTDTVDKIKGFELGAADYITKPIQHEEVLARVKTHLKLRRLQAELQAHNLELEQRNQELDAFAHTVAHDLKNPLNVMLASTSMLFDLAQGESQAHLAEGLELAVQAGKKMQNIIEALLLLAGVSKRGSPRLETLNMGEIVRQVLRERIAPGGEEAHIEVPETWPAALGYAPWVEEIWANYLSNGIKYGGQPPCLQLGVAAEDDGWRFWVRDNGPGLSADAQAKLFTPFTRLHKDRAEGHGLGLCIVRQIAEKLGGRAGVDSQPGAGSTFYFSLPAA